MEIDDYIGRLTQAFPTISSIWLMGSRANGTARETSDWDLLVFGDQTIFDRLKALPDFCRPDVDLLVVHDGENFEVPWGDRPKRGELTGWQWQQHGPAEASYRATKARPGDDFNVDVSTQRAQRLWPRR